MSKVVFLSYPLYGHVYPSLGVVRNLVEHGEEVIYITIDRFRQVVEKTGALFYPMGSEYDYVSGTSTNTGHNLPVVQFLFAYLTGLLETRQVLVDHFLPIIEGFHPDYIIYDGYSTFGKVCANNLEIPSICCIPTFAYNQIIANEAPDFTVDNIFPFFKNSKEYHAVKKNFPDILFSIGSLLKKKFVFESVFDVIVAEEQLTIVFTSKLFQPYPDLFNKNYRFVGPILFDTDSAQGEEDSLITEGNNFIFITMGTTFNQRSRFYQTCFQAMEGFGIPIIMSVGPDFDKSSLQDIPNNFVVRNFVPQRKLMPQAKLLISSGGMGTVSEALYYGHPVMVYPQGADQFMVSYQVEKLGAGIYIRHEIEVDELKKLTQDLLEDNYYRLNSCKIGDSFREAGGAMRAVEEIFKFKQANSIL